MEWDPVYLVLFLLLVLGAIKLKEQCRRDETTPATPTMPATPQAATDDLIEQERRMERRFRILTSIVHKVSRLSPPEYQICILPQ